VSETGKEPAGGGPLVLVVEDDAQMRRFLRVTLRMHQYRVLEATTAQEALVSAAARRPDLVMLDLGLPDADGLGVVAKLRTWYSGPVVVVSARHQEPDKIKALDAGADDYLTKPFGTGELLARLRAALRTHNRTAANVDQGVFVTGTLRVDHDRHEVESRGQPVKLTPLEYRLLQALIRHADKVVTRTQLLREVWGEAHVDEAHYLRVYMSALRHKLEADPARPQMLLTEPNVGYRLRTQ
jgi:two-component system KDP operon response regulator KdpE